MADSTQTVAAPSRTPTEFYLSLIPMAAGVVMLIVGAIKGNAEMINSGLITMGVTSTGYSVGRGIAKVTTTGADGRTPVTPTDAAATLARLP